MPEQVTLYSAKICPFAQRVEIAVKETKLDVTRFEVDLANKPEWYAPKVNPASKVPAIAYGGPIVPPDQPSSESQKIAESLVLLEFIADLTPSGTFRPNDPVLAARARFFIDAVSNKLTPAFYGLFTSAEDGAKLLAAIEAIQDLLPKDSTFAVGNEFTLADAAIAPFLGRLVLLIKNDLGAYDPGVGTALHKSLFEDRKFERFRAYWSAVESRESFKQTFNETYIHNVAVKRYGELRAKRVAAAAA